MHYNNFDPAKNVDQIRFRADRILQSAEMNELQSITQHRLRGISDALFRNGDVVRDARIIVNPETGATHCEAGAIYLDGAVRGVPPADIVIPTVGTVSVGVYLQQVIVTELDDPTLYNPAVGTRGYMEPGAERLQVHPRWGWDGDGQAGDFYAVYEVENGLPRARGESSGLDAIRAAIQAYDIDSAGGTYVVSGLKVAQAANLASGEQVYTVSEGRARINGVGIDQPASRRIVYDAQPDVMTVDSEPHLSAGVARQTITLSRPPARNISARTQSRRTVTIVHGAFAGAADPLPDSTVVAVEKVWQGEVEYQNDGVDFALVAGQIDWSPSGAEPAPGSSYQVTYVYMKVAEILDPTPTGFDIEGALPGTLVYVTYESLMRRIDRLCLAPDGSYTWVRGVAAEWEPRAPDVPSGLLALVSVYQTWDSNHRIIQDSVRMLPMWELAALNERLNSVIFDQAELRLAVDMSGRDSGIKKGLLADPFLSDEMRDQGMPQTAAIVGGSLQLPIVATVHDLANAHALTLEYGHSVAIQQLSYTGTMRVNPYAAFDPLPRPVVLNPAVDNWVNYDTSWASPITKVFQVTTSGWWAETGLRERSVTTVTLSESRSNDAFLREREVTFELAFGAGESLSGLTFDGLPITASPLPGGDLIADANGVLRGVFTVPAGVPVGTKEVLFTGTGGSFGGAFYTGHGVTVQQTLQQQTTEVWSRRVDPLAQTFTPTETRQFTGLDIWLRNASSDLIVQLCECSQGLPARPIAQTHCALASISQEGTPTRILWPRPVLLQAQQEYCVIIMCADATTAADVATLGEWDLAGARWVISQPYAVGVLLSSSNNSTWTPHQDRDLRFRLLAAEYTTPHRTVTLATVTLDQATDLIVQAQIDRPAAHTDVVFELEFDGGAIMHANAGQVLRLPAPFSGECTVRARISGDAKLAAVLQAGTQLVAGSLQPEGTYISRALDTGGGPVRVKAVFEGLIPGGAAVRVHVQNVATPETWVEVPYVSATVTPAGVREFVHELEEFTADRLRLRLTIEGAHTARPELRNLRVAVL